VSLSLFYLHVLRYSVFEPYVHYFVICTTFYLKCIIISYYSGVLLKRTTEVKTLPIPHVSQFHKSSCDVSDSQSHQRLV
jgi:hypothetical protein